MSQDIFLQARSPLSFRDYVESSSHGLLQKLLRDTRSLDELISGLLMQSEKPTPPNGVLVGF